MMEDVIQVRYKAAKLQVRSQGGVGAVGPPPARKGHFSANCSSANTLQHLEYRPSVRYN